MKRPLATLAVVLLAVAGLVLPTSPASATTAHPHYAANSGDQFAQMLAVGFNWVDVSSTTKMNNLPAGQQGVFYIGNGYKTAPCQWSQSDATITAKVQAHVGNPKFSGVYYIADEPHIQNCPDAPAAVAARTALIHSINPNAKTFIVVEDGSSYPGEFQAFANSADYIGADPYPCNVNQVPPATCNYSSMQQKIDTALQYIPASRLIPIFQTFGQSCTTGVPYYRFPTDSELSAMLAIWDTKVPPSVRAFDFAYGWANQSASSCPTLTDMPSAQNVISQYFAAMG